MNVGMSCFMFNVIFKGLDSDSPQTANGHVTFDNDFLPPIRSSGNLDVDNNKENVSSHHSKFSFYMNLIYLMHLLRPVNTCCIAKN